MFNIKKKKNLGWISDSTWDSLKLKDKDYIIFIYERRYTRKQIMRKLYFEDRTWFYKFEKRVRAKIKTDVDKFNEYLERSLLKVKNQ